MRNKNPNTTVTQQSTHHLCNTQCRQIVCILYFAPIAIQSKSVRVCLLVCVRVCVCMCVCVCVCVYQSQCGVGGQDLSSIYRHTLHREGESMSRVHVCQWIQLPHWGKYYTFNLQQKERKQETDQPVEQNLTLSFWETETAAKQTCVLNHHRINKDHLLEEHNS